MSQETIDKGTIIMLQFTIIIINLNILTLADNIYLPLIGYCVMQLGIINIIVTLSKRW